MPLKYVRGCKSACVHFIPLSIIKQKQWDELLEVRGVDIRITWADKHFMGWDVIKNKSLEIIVTLF